MMQEWSVFKILFLGILLPLILLRMIIPLKKLVILLLYSASLFLSVAWLLSEPGFEQAIEVLAAFGAIIGVDYLLGNKLHKIVFEEPISKPFDPLADLEIKVWKNHKLEELHDNIPFQQWALLIVLSNRGNIVVHFEKLKVIFVFHEVYTEPIKEFIQKQLKRTTEFRCAYYLHDPDPTYSGRDVSFKIEELKGLDIPHFVKLYDWETGQNIQIAPYENHRSPNRGDKEIWLLTGFIPKELGEALMSKGLYLGRMELGFYTDQGFTSASCSFHLLDDFPDNLQKKIELFLKETDEGFSET